MLPNQWTQSAGRPMTHAERIRLRDRHRSYLSMGFEVCFYCSDIDFVGRITNYPCDVIKVLDYLDVVEPMTQEKTQKINWAGGK